MNRLQYLEQPPKVLPISKIITPKIFSYISANDIPVFEVRKEGCGVVLLELVFRAGRPYEDKKMVASSCAAMMREGAGDYDSETLSEEIDYLGASLSISASLDYITVKGVCLKARLPQLIDIINAVLQRPHFSQKEWNHYRDKSKERLKVQLAKSDILSYRKITESMYGANHPYGYNSSEQLYDSLDVNHFINHHESYITAENCQIFISGDINDLDRKMVDSLCAHVNEGGRDTSQLKQERAVTEPEELFLVGRANQTSIRIGRLACTRRHHDFDGLNYVSNILGGYFGSRLITRLREEKGLTYNIYCSLDSQVFDGDLMISTEVANENAQLCIDEIFNEMDKLCTDLVDENELNHVNNYMMGNYLNLFDGPFNSIRAIKSLALAQIPLDELDSLIKSSLAFDAYQVRDMARKYYNRNDFWKVIVGTR